MLEHVTVTRDATLLRQGGSPPAIVEADNLGTYVMKFRGAGQGPLALVAEIIAGSSPAASACVFPSLSWPSSTRASRAASRPGDPGSAAGQRGPEPRRGLPAQLVRLLPARPWTAPAGLRQPGALVRRAGAQRRPDLAQSEPPGLAPQYLAHRSRRGAVLPPQLAPPPPPIPSGPSTPASTSCVTVPPRSPALMPRWPRRSPRACSGRSPAWCRPDGSAAAAQAPTSSISCGAPRSCRR